MAVICVSRLLCFSARDGGFSGAGPSVTDFTAVFRQPNFVSEVNVTPMEFALVECLWRRRFRADGRSDGGRTYEEVLCHFTGSRLQDR